MLNLVMEISRQSKSRSLILSINRSTRNLMFRQPSCPPPEFSNDSRVDQIPEEEPTNHEESERTSEGDRYTLESAEDSNLRDLRAVVEQNVNVGVGIQIHVEVAGELEGEEGDKAGAETIGDERVKAGAETTGDEKVKAGVETTGDERVKAGAETTGDEEVKAETKVLGEAQTETSGDERVKVESEATGMETVTLPPFSRVASIEDELSLSPAFKFITRPDLYKFAKVSPW